QRWMVSFIDMPGGYHTGRTSPRRNAGLCPASLAVWRASGAEIPLPFGQNRVERESMFPRKLLVTVLIPGLIFFAATGDQATAAGGLRGLAKLGGHHQPAEKPEVTHTTITLVKSDSITVSAGKDSKTYAITQDTEIQLKGSRVTVAELKPGMRVD